jgi:hypothetical protein
MIRLAVIAEVPRGQGRPGGPAVLAGCRGLCECRLRLCLPYRMALAAARAVRAAAVLTYARGHYGYRASSVVVTRPVAMS